MSTPKDGGPAFPNTALRDDTGQFKWAVEPESGMSLRDWFAGNAMQALMTCQHTWSKSADEIARMAHQHADAMLAERERRTT